MHPDKMLCLKKISPFVVLSFAVAQLFGCAEALSSGAPSMACASMSPYHFAFQAQPLDTCPFMVRQSKLSYRPGGNDTVTVVLSVKLGHPRRTFRGFLIKVGGARRSEAKMMFGRSGTADSIVEHIELTVEIRQRCFVNFCIPSRLSICD